LNPRTQARLLLLATVLIWGTSFAVVKSALTQASPLLFNLIRMTLATLALAIYNRKALRHITRPQLKAGVLAGLFLAAGYQFQTFGLARTSPAKSAFITGLVVVLVPLLTFIPFVRPTGTRRPGVTTILGALLAFAGLLLLTTPAGTDPRALFTSISAGDLLTLACALAFAFHLLTIARVSPGIPAGLLATLQIAAAALLMLLTLPLQTLTGPISLHLTPGLIFAWLLTALLGTAAAFTIQSFAQQHLPPTQTVLILTLEPVFAWLTALLLLHDRLGRRSLAGAALILLAIAFIELLPSATHTTEIPA
jgi:drug/metabolite transporter (DMT)-like permease